MKSKPKRMSEIELNNLYFNNEENCREFFIHAFYPNGFICPKCGHTHFYSLKSVNNAYQCKLCDYRIYLFAGTIFQDNKLPLYKLILGIYHFIHARNGISAEHLSTILGVNRKTGQLLARKLRIVMQEDNNKNKLESMFIETDVAYIGGVSKNGKRGLGTDKVPFLLALATQCEDHYPMKIRITQVKSENKIEIESFFDKVVSKKDKIIVKSDGKTSFNILKKWYDVKSKKINYSHNNHELKWLHIIISNIKSFVLGAFHGISKSWLYLHIEEFEWKFNHRNNGTTLMKYLQSALYNIPPHPRRCFIELRS